MASTPGRDRRCQVCPPVTSFPACCRRVSFRRHFAQGPCSCQQVEHGHPRTEGDGERATPCERKRGEASPRLVADARPCSRSTGGRAQAG